MNTTPKNDTEGTYRVSFRLGNTGRARFLESSKIVKAVSRAAAVEATPGGMGAEVIEWGPEDPEVRQAEIIARATGSVAATVTIERRDPATGEIVVESVQTYIRGESA